MKKFLQKYPVFSVKEILYFSYFKHIKNYYD